MSTASFEPSKNPVRNPLYQNRRMILYVFCAVWLILVGATAEIGTIWALVYTGLFLAALTVVCNATRTVTLKMLTTLFLQDFIFTS